MRMTIKASDVKSREDLAVYLRGVTDRLNQMREQLDGFAKECWATREEADMILRHFGLNPAHVRGEFRIVSSAFSDVVNAGSDLSQASGYLADVVDDTSAAASWAASGS
jgi:hypothetical protein